MAKKIVMTYEGMKKLQDELQSLKVDRRKDVAKKLQEAREQGDLSENAEYDAAKDEQRDIETRIDELEAILKNLEVVVSDDVDIDKISIGCTVDLLDVEFDENIRVQDCRLDRGKQPQRLYFQRVTSWKGTYRF